MDFLELAPQIDGRQVLFPNVAPGAKNAFQVAKHFHDCSPVDGIPKNLKVVLMYERKNYFYSLLSGGKQIAQVTVGTFKGKALHVAYVLLVLHMNGVDKAGLASCKRALRADVA